MHHLLTGPQGQELPVGYRWLVLKGLVDLCPWQMIEGQREAEALRDELLREIASPNTFPIQDWFPFARRQDRDDFAGFVIDDGQVKPEVAVIHLTFVGQPERPPWPGMGRFPTIWSWLQEEVIPAWEEWVDEEEVEALVEEQAARRRGEPPTQESEGVPSENRAPQEQAQSAWDHFVTHQVLPAFQEIKSINEQFDGTTVDIQHAPAGEWWVRLTWMVAPSPRMLAALGLRTAQPPRTVLTYTIIGDEPSVQTTAWSETRIPNKTGDLTSGSRVFREALGDYRRKDVTKDTITRTFLAKYQQHVLGGGR